MQPHSSLNQRISQLTHQLPIKRQQLSKQTAIITSACRAKLRTPEAFAAATFSGALFGLWLNRRSRGCENGSDTTRHDPEDAAQTDNRSSSPSALGLLYHHIWLTLWRSLLGH